MGAEGKRILLLDADLRSRRLLDLSLRREGYDVVGAGSVREGLEKYREQSVDLVIAEADLGGESGTVFGARLKESGDPEIPPVIYISESKVLARRLMEAGAADVLEKPLYLKEVLERIAAVIDRRPEEAPARREEFSGNLAETPFFELLYQAVNKDRTGAIRVKHGRMDGTVYIDGGEVVDAVSGQDAGEPALRRLFTWNHGSYQVRYGDLSERERRITRPTTEVLADAQIYADEWRALLPGAGSLDTVYTVEYRSFVSQIGDLPLEVNSLIRMFDGIRTLEEAIYDAEISDLVALRVVERLVDDEILMAIKGGGRTAAAADPGFAAMGGGAMASTAIAGDVSAAEFRILTETDRLRAEITRLRFEREERERQAMMRDSGGGGEDRLSALAAERRLLEEERMRLLGGGSSRPGSSPYPTGGYSAPERYPTGNYAPLDPGHLSALELERARLDQERMRLAGLGVAAGAGYGAAELRMQANAVARELGQTQGMSPTTDHGMPAFNGDTMLTDVGEGDVETFDFESSFMDDEVTGAFFAATDHGHLEDDDYLFAQPDQKTGRTAWVAAMTIMALALAAFATFLIIDSVNNGKNSKQARREAAEQARIDAERAERDRLAQIERERQERAFYNAARDGSTVATELAERMGVFVAENPTFGSLVGLATNLGQVEMPSLAQNDGQQQSALAFAGNLPTTVEGIRALNLSRRSAFLSGRRSYEPSEAGQAAIASSSAGRRGSGSSSSGRSGRSGGGSGNSNPRRGGAQVITGDNSPVLARAEQEAVRRCVDNYEGGDYEEALRACGQSGQEDSAEVARTIGAAHYNLGNNDEAREHLERAVQLDRSDGEAWLHLADTQRESGDSRAARDAYQRYLELNPTGERAEEVRYILDNFDR